MGMPAQQHGGQHQSHYQSLGFGVSLYSVASGRRAPATAGVHSASPWDNCYGVNLSIHPACAPANDARGQLHIEHEGLHRVQVALVGTPSAEQPRRIDMVCEPARGRSFDIELSRSPLAGPIEDAAQFDSDVHLDPGTYHFRIIVNRDASADFVVEV